MVWFQTIMILFVICFVCFVIFFGLILAAWAIWNLGVWIVHYLFPGKKNDEEGGPATTLT